MPPEVQSILNRRRANQKACTHVEWPRWCHYCAQANAAIELAPLTLRPFTPEVGFFALNQPYQYRPPGYAWTTIIPPIPPPRQPGDPPRPPAPWRLPFFLADFRYLDDPENRIVDPFDFLKRIPLPIGQERIVSDIGGESRWQGRVEQSRRLLGEQNNHNLFRQRLYLDTWFDDRFRTFFEYIWAGSSPQTVPPIFFDINRGDFLNAFGELKLYEQSGQTFSGRFGGRQQLLYGNHRLVSPLDWANSPRTFDNVANAVWRAPNWNLDGFWSRPNIVRAGELDKPNSSQQFFGAYAVYKGRPDRLYDLYYLGTLQREGETAVLNGEIGDLAIHTFGTRWQGQYEKWLWEGEAAYQFGHHRNLPRNAGMAAAGFARIFREWPFRPELWFYFDYASGNRGPDAGSFSTFNQLFPLGHKYFGYLDLVGRQNVVSPNVHARFYLGERATLILWYYNLKLASSRDALYNAGGQPIRFDPTGRAGRDIGNELDVVLNLRMNPHTDWQFGYSFLWAGTFVRRTAPDPSAAENPLFFYTQFTFRF